MYSSVKKGTFPHKKCAIFLLPVVTDIRVVETKYVAARIATFLEVSTLRPETPIKNNNMNYGLQNVV